METDQSLEDFLNSLHECYQQDNHLKGRTHQELLKFPKGTPQRLFADNVEVLMDYATPEHVIDRIYKQNSR